MRSLLGALTNAVAARLAARDAALFRKLATTAGDAAAGLRSRSIHQQVQRFGASLEPAKSAPQNDTRRSHGDNSESWSARPCQLTASAAVRAER